MPRSSSSLSCVVIDDEPLQHKVLEDYIRKMPALEFAAAFSNPLDAITFLKQRPADLIFLDIQMPELNGFQVMDILGPGSSIIITSAYRDFALAGFEYDVKDYLLKPVSFDRFCKAVTKVLNTRKDVAEMQSQDNFLFIKSGFKLVKVDLDQLLYIEGEKDYIRFVSPSGKIMSLQSLNSMEKRLDPSKFIRIHKSYIVSLARISQIEKQSVWVGDMELPLGNTYRDGFFEKINKWG